MDKKKKDKNSNTYENNLVYSILFDRPKRSGYYTIVDFSDRPQGVLYWNSTENRWYFGQYNGEISVRHVIDNQLYGWVPDDIECVVEKEEI